MATEKSLAIVLRVIEFSETSVIATLFTEQLGKISALAKGARRPKSPFEAALDLLAVCRIVFIHKSSEALDLLTEAKLERRFRSATRSLSRLYAGYYVSELLYDLTDPGDPHPELFRAANQCLLDLDQGEPVAGTVLRFELSLLRELGLLPSLDICVGCSERVEQRGRTAFGLLAGGVLCPRCRSGQRSVVSVSEAAMNAMRLLAEPAGDAWRGTALDRGTRGELRGLVGNYIAHVLGHRPKMHKYLGMLDAG
ncbi:MAG: DNA repair protein RecO [Pirellulaceae bacterium]